MRTKIEIMDVYNNVIMFRHGDKKYFEYYHKGELNTFQKFGDYYMKKCKNVH